MLDLTCTNGYINCLDIGFNNNNSTGSAGTLTVGGNSTVRALNGIPGQAAGGYISVGDGGNGVLVIANSGLVQAGTFYLGSQSQSGQNGGAGALHLNGGTLSVPQVQNASGTTGNIYFNGGALQAAAASGDFLQSTGGGTLSAYVQAGGAVIDSNGNNITINLPLQHDPALGSAADGGLTKVGSGSLILNAANSYTGPTTISAGTLSLGGVNGPGYNLPTTTALSIAASGVLDLGGNDQPVGSLSGSAGAIIANNLVYASTYTAILTVSPTFRRDDVRREHRRLDAIEFPRQRRLGAFRQRRIDPQRDEHVQRRNDGQRRHA